MIKIKNISISVIVPVYNTEVYLDKCLESLMNQTIINIEFIVVDDGSTDMSSTIIKKYCDMDERFRYYYKENGGLSSARNFGITKATGEYIGFIDSDDWIEESMFERLYQSIVEADADICICSMKYVLNNGNEINKGIKIKEECVVNNIEGLRRLFIADEYKCHAVNKLFKKELFYNIKFPEGKMYEDVATIYKLIYNAKKIKLIPDKLYSYLQNRPNSIVNSRFNEKSFDMFDTIDEIRSFTKEKNIYDKLKSEFNAFQVSNICAVLISLAKGYKNISKEKRSAYIGKCKNYIDLNIRYRILKSKYIDRKCRIRIILAKVNFHVFKNVEIQMRCLKK